MKNWLEKTAYRLDLPVQICADLPQITLNGFGEIALDRKRELLSYSETEILMRTDCGIVVIRGGELTIVRMKAGSIVIRGEIRSVELERKSER